MRKVFKYPLEFKGGIQKITIPGEHPRIIDIEFQNDELYAWALVAPDSKNTREIQILMVGTGHEIDDNLTNRFYMSMLHLKTVHRNGFVWHFFEVN